MAVEDHLALSPMLRPKPRKSLPREEVRQASVMPNSDWEEDAAAPNDAREE
jgi:hypothetical protein